MHTSSPPLAPPTLEVTALQTSFIYKRFSVKAVRDVSLRLERGKTLALVGESGSGKSVAALSLMGLLPPAGRIVGGQAVYRQADGTTHDLARLQRRQMRRLSGPDLAMIFQEPMTSLNPLLTVGDQIVEMLLTHERLSREAARKRTLDILRLVEIPAAERRIDDYPHQMSGGMRQRIVIAMALVCNPALLIADEPTTALDVTIQAQILDLMRRLQAELGMSILFITHDLGVVAEIAHQVAVMYAGEVVEQAEVGQLFSSPAHPYTQGLLSSIPHAMRKNPEEGRRARLNPIPGSVPPIHALPEGCTFRPRCPHSEQRCTLPVTLETAGPGHRTRCWKWEAVQWSTRH
ncbi:ABC transporter ATP-binding protein [Devosia sp. PTR5]|uniref:ABC transporter ATP-binding protein n=1 Tax=Devosia oryzisoli TaxID=2774138 RepID=A0A927ITS1_9HYPH|nr:ABC transporter ATP-binding protein [Devosia oryzisoli]MBD8065986.1 ABC transporter ATP-binding protein [Devosia oryzisoli]